MRESGKVRAGREKAAAEHGRREAARPVGCRGKAGCGTGGCEVGEFRAEGGAGLRDRVWSEAAEPRLERGCEAVAPGVRRDPECRRGRAGARAGPAGSAAAALGRPTPQPPLPLPSPAARRPRAAEPSRAEPAPPRGAEAASCPPPRAAEGASEGRRAGAGADGRGASFLPSFFPEEEQKAHPEKEVSRSRIPRLVLRPQPPQQRKVSPASESPFSEEESREFNPLSSSGGSARTISSNSFCSGTCRPDGSAAPDSPCS